jgi:pyruvate ferredoxin oxidoreductase beta subunit
MDRSNSLDSGHRACQGCGEALGARYAIDAAMRACNNQLIAANATGCLEVFTTPYPESAWRIPGCIPCSAMPRRWRPASPRHCA